jgi:hypothetical protein
MQFARYVAMLLLTCLAVYSALMGLSYVLFPAREAASIDTSLAGLSLYGTEPKYLFFSLGVLKRPGPRIVFLGASNVRDGFRPQEVQARLGNAIPVDNLGVGASEIREISELVDLAYEQIPVSAWRDQTFILGIWYGMFQPDALAWPDGATDLDRERARYGVLGRDGGALLRPVLLISRVYDLYVTRAVTAVRVALLRLAGETPADVTVTDRNSFHLTASERAASLVAWRKRMGAPGAWDEKQFQRFDALAREISRRGSRLVLLDLPLPAWHRDALAYDSQYRLHVLSHLKAALVLPGVSYASMRDGFSDEQFYDSAHPRPLAAPLWAARASAAVNQVTR